MKCVFPDPSKPVSQCKLIAYEHTFLTEKLGENVNRNSHLLSVARLLRNIYYLNGIIFI